MRIGLAQMVLIAWGWANDILRVAEASALLGESAAKLTPRRRMEFFLTEASWERMTSLAGWLMTLASGTITLARQRILLSGMSGEEKRRKEQREREKKKKEGRKEEERRERAGELASGGRRGEWGSGVLGGSGG